MARKKTAKAKEVVVRVKVSADGKPRRKRRVMAKQVKRGRGDIAQVGRTETLYRPYYPPPQPAPVMDATLPEQFRRQSPQVAGLLEDVKQVKQERANLLKDIERQTEQQIVQYVAKQQGAEQKGELAKAGAFDPFNTAEYEKPAPRIDEIDEGEYVAPFQSVPFIEDISPKQPIQTKQKPKLKVVEKLPPIMEKPPEKQPSLTRERPPVPIFTEPERTQSLTEMFVGQPIIDSELETETETEVNMPVREKRRPRTKEEETSLLEKSKAKALQAGLPERIEPRLGKIQRDDKKQLAQAIYEAQRRSGIVITGADIQRLYGIKPGTVMNLVRKIERGESLD